MKRVFLTDQRLQQVSVTVEIEGESIEIPHFNPRPLKNLLLIDQL